MQESEGCQGEREEARRVGGVRSSAFSIHRNRFEDSVLRSGLEVASHDILLHLTPDSETLNPGS